MNRFDSILVPLDGSPESAKALGCACWLASRLPATLHALYVAPQPLPSDEAFDRLRVPEEMRQQIRLQQTDGSVEPAVLAALTAQDIRLLVMSTRGASAGAGTSQEKPLGRVAQAVIERSDVPVLLLPLRYREVLPWKSMLVAVSGESSAEQALDVAVQLAAELDVKVNVAHCVEDDGGEQSVHKAPPLGGYADAPHHEHPERLEEIVTRGLSSCTREQCKAIGDVTLCVGAPAAELMRLNSAEEASVIALGWHGVLTAGRALVLKQLLEEAECPILLFKELPRRPVRLKVGEEFNHG